ncbi:UNVERIFIED_CONTAM: glutaredoxin-like YruB-family protein [Acetivibrio alkalicellulosi]
MEIKVYSTPTCPYCIQAKKYLESKNVQFQEFDVSTDREAASEMIDKSGQRGVPVIDVNGEIIIGFDKGRLDSLIS